MKIREGCKCEELGALKPDMTWEDLLEKVVRPQKYCTAGRWICPTLDDELRRADKERDRKNRYDKRRKAAGKPPATPRIAKSIVSFDFELDDKPRRRKVNVK